MNIHSPEAKTERQERNSQIVYLKEKGYSYNEIAKRYKLSRDTIKNICHEHGVTGIIPKNMDKLF